MSLYHGKPPQLAMIAGKVIMSGGFTDVIGGTMTAGSFDVDGSGLITWAPRFASAPSLFASINSGIKTMTSIAVRFTGVTVSNAYLELGAVASGGSTIGVAIVGEARL